jgi:hypothetical protein
MHQNLLNAEFALVWYLSYKNENMQGIKSLNRLQRTCTSAFAAHMPATNCILRVNTIDCNIKMPIEYVL